MARVTSKVMLGSGSIDNFKEYAAEIPLSVIDEMLISEAKEERIRRNHIRWRRCSAYGWFRLLPHRNGQGSQIL